jgi:N-acetylmuramoyl-L-alanine amidase
MLGDPAFSRRLLLGHGLGAALLLPVTQAKATQRSPTRSQAARTAPLIVLDAGHGGKDPGAIGVSGTYEKHVSLATAGELARQLHASGRYRIALTRESDDFIPLDERVSIAQARGASLFISLHADALVDHSVRGASVYTLAGQASDAQSAALATRENAADRFAGHRQPGVTRQVAEILASLVQHETRLGSARAQQRLVVSLGGTLPMLENPARHAAFEVLKAADIPSVLIEMGFMSNAHDEAALRQPAHRAMVATAIRRAVDVYFASDQHPNRAS